MTDHEPTHRDSGPTVICTYRVQEGKEDEFTRLLELHWPTLRKAGLATQDTTQVFRGTDKSGKTFFNEIFTWVPNGPQLAHETPEVMAVWEPMGALCEARDGRPPMEFPHVTQVDLALAEV